jgi:hypothetical protein
VRNSWTRQIEGLVFVYDMNERGCCASSTTA